MTSPHTPRRSDSPQDPRIRLMRVDKVDQLSFPLPDSLCRVTYQRTEVTIQIGDQRMAGQRIGRFQFQGPYFEDGYSFVLTLRAQGAEKRLECQVYKGRTGHGHTHAGSWTADEDGDD